MLPALVIGFLESFLAFLVSLWPIFLLPIFSPD